MTDPTLEEIMERLLRRRRLGSFYLDDVRALVTEIERQAAEIERLKERHNGVEGSLLRCEKQRDVARAEIERQASEIERLERLVNFHAKTTAEVVNQSQAEIERLRRIEEQARGAVGWAEIEEAALGHTLAWADDLRAALKEEADDADA